jgi:hypothetical protein
MKKFLTLSLAAAMAIGFAACSSEDLPQPVQITDDHDGSYIQLKFQMPEATSRAYENETTESSGEYVLGQDFEYEVKKVYLAFYQVGDNNSETLIKIDGKNFYELEVYKESVDGTTHEDDNTTADTKSTASSTGKAATWTSIPIQLPSGIEKDNTYHVYALINKAPETADITSSANLLNSTMAFAIDDAEDSVKRDETSGNVTSIIIPMSARSYDGTVYQVFTPKQENTYGNPAVLTFEVERSYARIAFPEKSHYVDVYTKFTPTDADQYAVAGDESDTYLGQILLDGYQIVNIEQSYYTYRHVGQITGDGTSDYTLTQGGYGPATTENPYVLDPNTAKKHATGNPYESLYQRLANAVHFSSYDGMNSYGSKTAFKQLLGSKNSVPQSVEYVPENCMKKEAQRKGQTTGIIFLAKFIPTTIDGEPNDHKDWVDKDLYYYDGQFFSSLAKITEHNKNITPENKTLTNYNIRFFRHGVGYYEYYIRHVDNEDYINMGQMEFGIVRNNSYELKVKSVVMSPYSKLPGDPDKGLDPDPDDPNPDIPIDNTDPDPNDDDESAKVYMQVDVNVRPWIVRTNNMILGL